MKKLLPMQLALLVLVAFTSLSVGHNRKAGEAPAAIPPADKVTLSGTSNMVSKKCSVTAKPGLIGNPAAIYKDHSVNFQKKVGLNWPDLTPNPVMVTNAQGVTPSRTVPWNSKIRAWITKQNGQKAYSAEFTCGGKSLADAPS